MVAESIWGQASSTVAHQRHATLLEAYNFLYMHKYTITLYKHAHININIYICVLVFSYMFITLADLKRWFELPKVFTLCTRWPA